MASLFAVTVTLGSDQDTSSHARPRRSKTIAAAPVAHIRALSAKVATTITPSMATVNITGPSGTRSAPGVCHRRHYILMSNSTLGDAKSIAVATSTATSDSLAATSTHSSVATIVGRDPLHDLAVLKVKSCRGLADGATGPAPKIGQHVVAVTSSMSRLTPAAPISGVDVLAEAPGGQTLAGLLEIDTTGIAAGSALVDSDGRMVAIIAARQDVGRSVALPFAVQTSVAEDLIVNGTASHGWLGVDLVDPVGATKDGEAGALVTAVEPDSPAHRASIEPGDVIVAVDDTKIAGVADLLKTIRQRHAGDRIYVALLRGSQAERVWVDLGDYGALSPAGP